MPIEEAVCFPYTFSFVHQNIVFQDASIIRRDTSYVRYIGMSSYQCRPCQFYRGSDIILTLHL